MTNQSISKTRKLTVTAVLSAVAFLLAFIEFPVPLSPSFARMDLSDLPALIGAFAYGPLAGAIYKAHKTKRMALVGGIAGSLVMGVVAAITNYYILLPLFEQFMPIDEIIASFGTFIPFIKTKLDVVIYNAFPFNVLKGLVITLITMLIYKKLRPVLKGAQK